MFCYTLFSIVLAFTLSNAQLVEKTVKAAHAYNKTCIEISKSSASPTKCEFFRCFEDRFPCGPQYWNLRWGMKYCKKYTDPSIISGFTADAQKFLNQTNTCISHTLERTYQKERSLKCKDFYQKAFKAQSKCYSNNQALFCKIFPENKNQFNKITEMKDYMDQTFISMIKNALAKCFDAFLRTDNGV